MNTKTTLTLAAIVAVLTVWVWFGEQHVPTTSDLKKEAKKLAPGFKSDDATRVEIARIGTSTETLVFAREEEKKAEDGKTSTSLLDSGKWKMEQPVQDRADDATIRGVISKLEWLESSDTLEGERAKKANAESFGSVVARLAIKRKEKEDLAIEIGSELPGDQRYARVAGKETVYVIKKDLLESLTKDQFEFRGKELVAIQRDDAAKVVVKVAPASAGPGQQPRLVELAKKDGFWKLGGENGDYADRKKVEDLIDKVRGVRPTGIEKDAPTPDDLKRYGLDPQAAFEVLLEGKDHDGKDVKESLLVGAKVGAGDARWAKRGDKPFVYKLDAADLERELAKDATTYRSDLLFQLKGGEPDIVAFGAEWKGGPSVQLKRDGSDWKLEKPNVRLEEQPAKDLLHKLLDQKVVSREPEATDLAKVGLAEPGLVLTVGESTLVRELKVGEPVKEKPGHYYVKRGEDARVVVANLGDLPELLRRAPLDLRSKTVFKANHWEMKKLVVTGADGKERLELEKVNSKWTAKGESDADEDKIGKFLELFDEVKATELVADASPETQAKYGVDKPERWAFTVSEYDSKEGKSKDTAKTLLVGRREGDKVLVMEEGGATIARVPADFLDKAARGWKKGKAIFEANKYDARKIVVREGDRELVFLEKVDFDWFRGTQKLEFKDAEKLLDPFGKVEATSIEEASDAKKKERGLAPPARTVTISVKPPGSAEEAQAKTLLIGAKQADGKRYAMAEGGTELGAVWDDVVTEVDSWLAEHPAPTEAPKTTPPDAGPVASPTRTGGEKK